MNGQPATPEQQETFNKVEAENGAAPRTTATKLIDIGSNGVELFHDERGDGYAKVKDGVIHKTLRLRGKEFRRWCAGKYWERYQGAANSEALQNAINVLEAKATHEGKERMMFNRFAVFGDAVYIDLCDEKWQAVKVTPEGFATVPNPGFFRRYSHQRPLPYPELGGSLDRLDGFLNVKPDDLILVKAWLSAVYVGNIPRPILTPHGVKGSAKTTLCRVLRRLTDPSLSECLSFPRDENEIAQLLDHHAVPVLDNVSKVGHNQGDILCRSVTGGAFSKRELYSDAEDIIFSFKRAVILNGINIPSHAPDLLDRMMLIELERVSDDRRKDEKTFWADFDAQAPKLFGAVLTATAGMLRSEFKADRLPRMADFALLGARWAEGQGIGGGEKFLTTYAGNVSRQVEEALESDSVAIALRELVKAGSSTGTPSELLKKLNDQRGLQKAPEDWPRSAEALGKRLRVIESTLHDSGIEVTHHRDETGRRVTVGRAGKPSGTVIPTSKRNGNQNLDGLTVETGVPPVLHAAHIEDAERL